MNVVNLTGVVLIVDEEPKLAGVRPYVLTGFRDNVRRDHSWSHILVGS